MVANPVHIHNYERSDIRPFEIQLFHTTIYNHMQTSRRNCSNSNFQKLQWLTQECGQDLYDNNAPYMHSWLCKLKSFTGFMICILMCRFILSQTWITRHLATCSSYHLHTVKRWLSDKIIMFVIIQNLHTKFGSQIFWPQFA